MRLLGCTETVTLIRHEQTPTGDNYTREVLRGVSWFEKVGAPLSASTGERPQVEITVRIPTEACPAELPQAGDYLVRGEPLLPQNCTPACLAGLDAFRIVTVGDNRRVCLPHVVVMNL